MANLDRDDAFEPQDEAETFDETHRTDELGVGSDDLEDEPDLQDDVYDVTLALGDADEDDEDVDSADDLDPEELDDLDDEEDEDEDDDLDDDLEDEPEDDDLDDDDLDDEDLDEEEDASAASEPGLVYAADLDALTNPRDDDVEKYESNRELSGAQLADLGYMKESRSFASSEDIADTADPDDSRRLDEGLEETFPASDPVSAKHIS
jgi:hypothetical protein